MTIGTSIICGSFCFMVIWPAHLPHSAPNQRSRYPGKSRKWSAFFFRFTRTGDKESPGSFRCGFSFGFYRGPHPVSNERELLRTSVLTVVRETPARGSVPHR